MLERTRSPEMPDDAKTHKWLVEVTDESFEQDVLQSSQDAVVVLDFWATWCQPCTMLGPILESVIAEFDGEVILAKANTDLAPKAATEYGVQSIPAVYAVVQGEPVDGFQGLISEDDLRQWLDRIVRHKTILGLQAAEASEPATAKQGYQDILADDDQSPHANIGLARVLLSEGDSDGAAEIIERLEKRGFLEPEAERVKAQLSIESVDTAQLDTLRTAAEDGNFEAQLTLAQALAAAEQYDEACMIAIDLVTHDRGGTGVDAHQLMLNVFSALPDDSEVTSTYRRKLAMALY